VQPRVNLERQDTERREAR